MKTKKIYQALATAINARKTCLERADITLEITERWDNYLDQITLFLPNGSGFNRGTTIDLDKSREDCLILNTSFHHMNDRGYYDGWTDHVIRVKPSLMFGFTLTVSGNKNDVKDYIHDVFHNVLSNTLHKEVIDGKLNLRMEY